MSASDDVFREFISSASKFVLMWRIRSTCWFSVDIFNAVLQPDILDCHCIQESSQICYIFCKILRFVWTRTSCFSKFKIFKKKLNYIKSTEYRKIKLSKEMLRHWKLLRTKYVLVKIKDKIMWIINKKYGEKEV